METTARRKTLAWTAVAIGALIVAGGGWYLFAPRGEETLDDAAPAGAEVVRTGSFVDGAPGHTTSGTVQLLRDGDGYVLHFEGYDATPGPAVYFYLVREAGASTTEAVEGAGVRIPVEATMRGSFNLDLPADVDPAEYAGLAVWCERFNVLFGSAPLA